MSTVPQIPIRKYNISDTRAIQDCRTTHGLLGADLADFTALAPVIDATWLTDWDNDIQAAEAVKTDAQHQAELSDLTEDVEEAMVACRRVHKQVKLAVALAFGDDRGMYNRFGFNQYDKVRQSDAALQLYTERLHAACVEHQAALDATGAWDATKTADVDAAAQALRRADNAQEEHIRKRADQTENRVNRYNNMWERRQLVAQVAKVLYMDDYGKYQQYLLPASDSAPEDFAITGVVNDAATNSPIEFAEVSIASLDLTVLTDSNGRYGIVDNIPPGAYLLTFSKEGYTKAESNVTVTSADETLTVNKNLNAV